jgi:hypothetical protein
VPWEELTAKTCFCHGIESFPKTETLVRILERSLSIGFTDKHPDVGPRPRVLSKAPPDIGLRVPDVTPSPSAYAPDGGAYLSCCSYFATTWLNDFIGYSLRLQQFAPRCTSQTGRAVLSVMSSSLSSTLHIPVQFFLSFSYCFTS